MGYEKKKGVRYKPQNFSTIYYDPKNFNASHNLMPNPVYTYIYHIYIWFVNKQFTS